MDSARRERVVETCALALIALLVIGAAAVRPIWAALDPAQALADAVWVGANDPWGRCLRASGTADDGSIIVGWATYSAGPDGVDQSGSGDDLYPAPAGPARFLYRASRLGLAFAAIALLALVAALRKPRGRWWVEAALALPFGLGMAIGALTLAHSLETDGLVALDDLARTWLEPNLAIFSSATLSGTMIMFLARANLAPT